MTSTPETVEDAKPAISSEVLNKEFRSDYLIIENRIYQGIKNL